MRRVAQQPAFILHNRAYRNTSLLLDVLTRDHGRIGLVARGVRGANAARRARLQAFRELRLSYSGAGELKNLADVEEAAPAAPLQGEALACAYYANELLMKLTPRDDVNDGLFDLYRETLERLAESADIEVTLRVFELQLLQCLGYGLALEHDDRGAALVPDTHYDYVENVGPVAAVGLAPQPGVCRVSGACLIALGQGQVPAAYRNEAKRLLKNVLQMHLGTKTLRSREFLADLRRLRSRP